MCGPRTHCLPILGKLPGLVHGEPRGGGADGQAGVALTLLFAGQAEVELQHRVELRFAGVGTAGFVPLHQFRALFQYEALLGVEFGFVRGSVRSSKVAGFVEGIQALDIAGRVPLRAVPAFRGRIDALSPGKSCFYALPPPPGLPGACR